MPTHRRTEVDWPEYLSVYHRYNAGITESAFERLVGCGPGGVTPHDWLADAVKHAGRALDIGCGSAPMYPRLKGLVSYVGVDLSVEELALARSLGRGPVLHADTRALPIADGSVDTVLSSMALMLVSPLGDALTEISRVLRPGGQFAALVPTGWPFGMRDVGPLLRLGVALRGPGAMPQRVSALSWHAQLSKVGLIDVDTDRRLFRFPVRNDAEAALAVRALYTPGRSDRQRQRAVDMLSRWAAPGRSLPVPLLRVRAVREGEHEKGIRADD